MNPNNLLLDSTVPWKKKFIESGYADIDSGTLWSNGWSLYCKSDKREVLCPLIFFIDRTHTDVQGKLSLEPVCFTLGIFNRTTRNKAHAWRTIGYIPNFDLLSKYKKNNTTEKVQDYHHMLSFIFQDVYNYQKLNKIPWKLFGIECSLKIPVFFIPG